MAQPGRAQFVSVADDRNRKATIVIEHLIQASDVSHTMQHWEVYISWNEKLFEVRLATATARGCHCLSNKFFACAASYHR